MWCVQDMRNTFSLLSIFFLAMFFSGDLRRQPGRFQCIIELTKVVPLLVSASVNKQYEAIIFAFVTVLNTSFLLAERL